MRLPVRHRVRGTCPGHPGPRTLLLALPLLLAGCEEDLAFDDPDYSVWIAQNVSGAVVFQDFLADHPVQGATVVLSAGFHPDRLIPIGVTVSGLDGSYELRAEDSPSARAGFWRFAYEGDPEKDVKIHLRVEAYKQGYYPAEERRQVLRRPSSRLPAPSEAFFLVIQVPIWPMSKDEAKRAPPEPPVPLAGPAEHPGRE